MVRFHNIPRSLLLNAPDSARGGGGNPGPTSPHANRAFMVDASLRAGKEVLSFRKLCSSLDGLGYHHLALTVVRIALGETKPSVSELRSLQTQIREVAEKPLADADLEKRRLTVQGELTTVNGLEQQAGRFPRNVYLLNMGAVFCGHLEGHEARMWDYLKSAGEADAGLPNLLYNQASKKVLFGRAGWQDDLARAFANCEQYGMNADDLKKNARGDKDFAKVYAHPDFLRLTAPAT